MGSKTLSLKKGNNKQDEAKKPLKLVATNPGKIHRVEPQIPLTLPKQKAEMTAATTTPTVTEAQAAVDLKTQMMELAQNQVPFKVLAPFASCLVTPDQLQAAIEANYKEIFIFTNGQFFQHMQLRGNRHVRLKVDHLPERYKELETVLRQQLASVDESLDFLPAGKIPGEMWDQIVAFFRQVMKVKKSDMEAHAWILWNEAKGYHISIPKQVVSKASVGYTWDPESVPSDSIVVVDVHSHNTMGAFYSGTDEADDKDKIYYTGVVGKITDNDYEWVLRFNMRNVKIKTKLDEIFDMTTKVSVPQEWLDQVEVRTYQSPSVPGPGTGKSWNQYVGRGGSGNVNGTSGGPGSSPQNPAKWTARSPGVGFPMTQQQLLEPTTQGGAGPTSEPFSDTGTLWDSMGDGSFGYGDAYALDEGTARGNVSYDGERDTFRRSPGRRAEMEALLRDVPGTGDAADLDRLEQQAIAWMRRQGYDEHGNDMLTNAREELGNEVKEMKGTLISDDTEQEDPVGSMVGGVEVHSALHEEIRQEHGEKAADAYDLIDVLVTELEGVDVALLDIATQCYHLMSEEGQQKLETNGF